MRAYNVVHCVCIIHVPVCVISASIVIVFAADKCLDSELGTADSVDADSVQLKHWNTLPDCFDQPFLRGTSFVCTCMHVGCNLPPKF